MGSKWEAAGIDGGALLKSGRSGVLRSVRHQRRQIKWSYDMRFEDQSAVLEWLQMEMQTVRRHQPIEIKCQRRSFETVAAAVSYATTTLPAGSHDNATIRTGAGITLRWADIEAMSKAQRPA